MKEKITTICICAILLFSSYSCNFNNSSPQSDSGKTALDTGMKMPDKPIREKVLTAAEQAALTPNEVIASLKEGNGRFVRNDLTLRNHSVMVRNAVAGQYPKAVVLSCIDSRVPVEDVFDKGIGDMFVIRIAGNISNPDILGSAEYGCKVSGAKLILVLGHEFCGAIKSAIKQVKLGNITALLNKLQPAVKLSQNFKGEKSVNNPEFVEDVAKNNILHTIEAIRTESPLLKEMESKGEIKIVGALYSLKTGEVTFL